MVEFLIVLPVLLLILLGTLQFAFIYHAKITLNYATFESVRAGSLNNARPFAMEYALARALAPLYTHQDSLAAVQQGREKLRDQIKNGYILIDIVNPTQKSFDDYRSNGAIPVDNIIYRGAKAGKKSGQTIQDANLLKVQVFYCYELIVPFVNRIIWSMMRFSPADAMPGDLPEVKPQHRFGRPAVKSFAETCIAKKHDAEGYFGIPIRSQAIMRMQSPAMECAITDSCDP